MHSWTTSSGADAPAVIRTVSTPSNQLGLDLRDAVDQVRRDAQRRRRSRPAARLFELFWLPSTRTSVGPGRQLADGLLAVLRGVADVVLGRVGDLGELLPECGDHDVGVVDAQRRLGEIGDLARVGDLEPLDVLGRLDQDHLLGGLAHGADDLVVALVADQDDGVAFAGVLDGLEVDLGDERAGGVDGEQPAARGPGRGSGARRRGRCRAGGSLRGPRRATRRRRSPGS